MENKEIKVCLIGATSGIGLWTAYYLLEQKNVRLTVVVRDEDKLNQIFKERVDDFYQVYVGDVEKRMQVFEGMWDKCSSVNISPFEEWVEDIEVVINTVGPSKLRNKEHSRIVDLEVNRLLVAAAQKQKVQKFILVTSMYVTRPSSLVAFMLNFISGMTLSNKHQAENLLRLSGLDYVILRPGALNGNKHCTYLQMQAESKQPIQNVHFMQGDTGYGNINRSTVGRLIATQLLSVDTLKTTVDTPKSTVDTLKTTVDTPKSTVDTLKTTVDTPKSTVDTLKTTVDTPKSTVGRLTMEVVAMTSGNCSASLNSLKSDSTTVTHIDHLKPTQLIRNKLILLILSTLVLLTSLAYYYITSN